MTTTAYVDEFIDDVREIFDATQDPLAQAKGVSEKMEVLLQTPGLAGGAVWSFRTRAGTGGTTCTWTRTTGIRAAVSG